MAPIQYIDILEIEAWGCNAQKSFSGPGRMLRLGTELPVNAADERDKPVGVLFDTETPAEPRGSSCWLIGLL